MTNRPELANYAKYPAANWFRMHALRTCLKPQGFGCLDLFDLAHPGGKGLAALLVPSMQPGLPPLQLIVHLLAPIPCWCRKVFNK